MSARVSGGEPSLAVGLLDGVEAASIRLEGDYLTPDGVLVAGGELRLGPAPGGLRVEGAVGLEATEFSLAPVDPERAAFSLVATIGIDFHWQQEERQRFRGGLRLFARAGRLVVVNRVPLETYLASVIGSEMNAEAPLELARAHAVISRSWLLAQLAGQRDQAAEAAGMLDGPGEIRRWTDRQAHADFDVCADDHCQRYQGIGRSAPPEVGAATRGLALTADGAPCDARFSKCCGGLSEAFPTAWGEREVPYLRPVADWPGAAGPLPDLTGEAGFRAFLDAPPPAFCDCREEAVLERVLNSYDRQAGDFFRWRVRLSAEEAGRLVRERLGRDLGRLVAFEPLGRGPSGRLHRLRLVGERGALVVGKELVIRRALSSSHLRSSAFLVEPEGPAARPEAFVLRGAGWGHGVGLCQIGAAAMACGGQGFEAILSHYYPGTRLERLYP
jgi:peptidoglycan hydrolase-like amidase